MMRKPSFSQHELKKFLTYRKDGSFRRKERADNSDPKGQIVRGSLRPDGYRKIQIKKEQFLFHQLIYFWHHGYLPENIDHKDRNKGNNRINNLKDSTPSENSRNCGVSIRNKSGHKGVIWRTGVKRWIAFIEIKGRYRHLYCGKNKQRAIRIRKNAEKKIK